jgi:poly(3-hydroxyalkanoate) synthetase
MFRQLTHGAFGATTLGARVMAKAIAVPVDTALWAHETTNRKPPTWHSRNEVVLASPFALLRDFSVGDDDVVPTLLFPPLAGHASCIIDKKGQSQIQLCLNTGLTRLYSFDWLSCTKAAKDTTETDRLDFITRAADLIAGPEGKVNIVGNCQGGWEATLWAAMHPERVNTLIVAGAPIDTSAGNGPAQKLMPIVIPRGNMALYKAMVKANGGIVPGINLVMGFIAMHPITHVAEHLKVYAHVHDREYLDHFSDFYDWYLYPVNLPGKLYLWAVEHLFVRNEMFTGELEVAGDTVSLRSITCPVFLLGGEEDDITPWQQVHNMRHAVGSSQVHWYLAPGGHIGLFIGRQSQAEYWTPILAQVHRLSRPAGITNATTSTATRVAGRASENRLLNGSGDLNEAEQTLRVRAGAGDERAARRLAELLAQRGDLDEAEQILRARADTGDESAVSRLAELLAELLAQHGDPGKLRTRADTGDRDGATELAGLLEERADPDGALQILRAWANVGDWDAARSGHGTANVTGPRTGRQRLRATTAPGEEPDMSNASGTTFLSVLRQLAETDPDRPALTCGDITLTRAGFVDRVERLAAQFEARGVAESSTVTISLPNSIGFVESMFAAWAVGAVPQPVSHRLPAPERSAIMGLASPSLVVGMPQSEAGPWPTLESVPGQLPAGSLST